MLDCISGGTTLYIGLTEVTLAYTPPAGMGNTGVSADGFDLRKRGATVAWDAGVFDGQHAITQTGFAHVRVETKYSGYRLFGLTTSDIGGGFCPTRYGLELVHGGTLEVYENCVRVAYNQAALVYGAGDQLRIEADAGVVRYKRLVGGAGTWQVLYTSTLPVTAALYFNASLYTPGSTLKEIRFVSGSTGAPSVNRTYYTFGGARVAMRDGAGAALVYLHGDHLGSASLATSVTGTVVSQQRYAPYGEVRWSSGSAMPTDFTFTSQRAGPANYVGSLMDYVARGYSPALGRFVSADTIVPGARNPQAYNRYMYVLGNPIKYTDPTGHCPICFIFGVQIGMAARWGYWAGSTLPEYFGMGPDRHGIDTAVSLSTIIEQNARGEVPPIMLGAAIAGQSQWGGGLGDWGEVNIQRDVDPSLGTAQLTRDDMTRFGGGASALDDDAAIGAMSNKIANALAGCGGCTATDRFAVAGIAQNQGYGPGWAAGLTSEINPKGPGIDWAGYFKNSDPAMINGLKDILTAPRAAGKSWEFFIFRQYVFDLKGLMDRGWILPAGVNFDYLQCVASEREGCAQ